MEIWLIFQNFLNSFSANSHFGISRGSEELVYKKNVDRNDKKYLNCAWICWLLESMKSLCIEFSKPYQEPALVLKLRRLRREMTI